MGYAPQGMRGPPIILAGLVLALGCHPSAMRRSPPILFHPTGAIASEGLEVAFDAEHVVGSRVEMAQDSGGSWSGTVLGHPARIEVGTDSIDGTGCRLHLLRKGEFLRLDGVVAGRNVHVTLSRSGLTGYSDGGACAFDYMPLGGGTYRGVYACPPSGMQLSSLRGEVHMSGAAAAEDPPMPQFALALVSVLPPY
ncbi:MAG TPA: hypothetical protein VFG59_06050 [Anaeromyxobacter sp.]|nr:hypothetical protein [Anaeromyxobacter sp.]